MAVTKSIKKMIEQKQRYRAYREHAKALPVGYRTAIEALERYLMFFGPGEAEAFTRMFEDLGELFEQSAAAGTPVRDVVGDDPVEFAETFLRNYPEGQWLHKERRRLADAIERAGGEA